MKAHQVHRLRSRVHPEALVSLSRMAHLDGPNTSGGEGSPLEPNRCHIRDKLGGPKLLAKETPPTQRTHYYSEGRHCWLKKLHLHNVLTTTRRANTAG
jgi:hypothetical protein